MEGSRKECWRSLGRPYYNRMMREEAGAEGEDDDEEWNSYRQFQERRIEEVNADIRATVGKH
jgi:hypothetical protein